MQQNTPAANRLKVAIGTAIPNPDGGQRWRPNQITEWPCKRDHPHSEIVYYSDGSPRCRACNSEDRQANREANLERERRHDRRRKRAAAAAARAGAAR